MARYILEDGYEGKMEPLHGIWFSGAELRNLVEGEFHIIGLLEQGVLVFNNEYYGIGVKKNEKATKLAEGFIPKDTWIAGPALHIPESDYLDIVSHAEYGIGNLPLGVES